MEPLFISQWTHDNHSLYELVPIFRKHPSRILLITMPMVIIIVIFFLALWGIFGFQDYSSASGLFLFHLCIYRPIFKNSQFI